VGEAVSRVDRSSCEEQRAKRQAKTDSTHSSVRLDERGGRLSLTCQAWASGRLAGSSYRDCS